jgi:hypothetical protein
MRGRKGGRPERLAIALVLIALAVLTIAAFLTLRPPAGPDVAARETELTPLQAARLWLMESDGTFQECGLSELDVGTDLGAEYPVEKPAFNKDVQKPMPSCEAVGQATNLFEYNPCKGCNTACMPDYAVRWVYTSGGLVAAAYEQNRLEDRFVLLECSG